MIRIIGIRISGFTGRTFSVLLLTGCLLLMPSCSKRAFRGISEVITESTAEKKRLDEFLAHGAEKPLDTRNTSPDEIIRTARQYLGVPHCMGGKSFRCIDCSGLVAVVFATHGIQLPHNSEEQARYGKIIASGERPQKGDLVFFIRTYSTSRFITHSGICVGENRFIHASTSLGVVVTSLDDPWWSERYLFATRVFQ